MNHTLLLCTPRLVIQVQRTMRKKAREARERLRKRKQVGHHHTHSSTHALPRRVTRS